MLAFVSATIIIMDVIVPISMVTYSVVLVVVVVVVDDVI